MFERYTERARRLIFFARYEAMQYGSHLIETEHLLLGLLRENAAVIPKVPSDPEITPQIRAEIEKRIPRAGRISTSVEVPLSPESKQALILAASTADKLNHRQIEPAHILVGILQVKTSMATQILLSRGLTAQAVRESLAKAQSPQPQASARISGLLNLTAFLDGLKSLKSDELISFFATRAEFIDVAGKRWGHEEIKRKFDALIAPYAKRNATYVIESTLADTNELLVATVLWKNALLASEQRAWLHRMTVVLVAKPDDWEIVLIQLTAVQPS
jgi:ATP-dependent Clp protease ATP-binding subunit ClpA